MPFSVTNIWDENGGFTCLAFLNIVHFYVQHLLSYHLFSVSIACILVKVSLNFCQVIIGLSRVIHGFPVAYKSAEFNHFYRIMLVLCGTLNETCRIRFFGKISLFELIRSLLGTVHG